MKIILNKILLLIVAATFLASCDKEELTVLDSNAETTVSVSDNDLVLDILNTGQDALTVNWTEPEFGYDAAVVYSIIFKSGNFTSIVPVGNILSKTFETAELNKILINLGIAPSVSTAVTIQVDAVLSEYKSISSNVISVNAAPFSSSFAPIYMIGDALLGWDTAKAVEVYGKGPGTYEVIAKFNNGGAFRFFSAPDWDAASKYNWTYFTGSVDSKFVNAADGDTNIRFVGPTGFYKISVNLIAKTIAMSAVDEPKLFMVGAGVPAAGWNWNSPVQMTWVKDGVFQVSTGFINDTFRFFTGFGDWGSGLNYPYYINAEFDIDSDFENANDGDKNFKFIGTPGTYTLTVNYLDKTITLE